MSLKKSSLYILILFSLIITGCIKKSIETDAPKDRPLIENDIREETRVDIPQVKSPLSGLVIDKKLEKQRPIAVMIENEYHSRPQSGIDKASIVYEALVEGGITRFVAIYLDKEADEIGPVRSSRPYFIDIAMEYDGIYVHYGQSPQAETDLKILNIYAINGIYDAITFWRDSSRQSPHNAYTSTSKILETAKKHKSSNKILPFVEFTNEPIKGQVLRGFGLQYTKDYEVCYFYDESKQVYERFINNEPHVDKVTKENLRAKNIIVQFMETRVFDDEGRLKIKTVGQGYGYYICEGKIQDIIWEKDGRKSKTVFFNKDGEKLKLKPGNTWIQIMPTWSRLNIK